jgi:hypothetical protein
MRYTQVLLAALAALLAYSDKTRAIDSARDLVNSCQELERGREGAEMDSGCDVGVYADAGFIGYRRSRRPHQVNIQRCQP